MKTEAITRWVDVTPALAQEWIEKYNCLNRPVKDSVVKKYAKDMREGRWLQKSTTPIVFDWNGALVDGQHRLWAIFESDITITCLVVENADPRQRQVTDIGAPRTLRDIMGFEGISIPKGAAPIVKRMIESFDISRRMTMSEQREAYLRHQEAVHWVLLTFNSRQRGLRSGGVLAPVARAYYSRDREVLTRFLEVVRNGIMLDQKEIAAVLLRNFAITSSQKGHNSGGAAILELYAKAERCLVAFLEGDIIMRIHPCTEEQFPIEDDLPKAKSRPRSAPAAKIVKIAKSRK